MNSKDERRRYSGDLRKTGLFSANEKVSPWKFVD